MITIPITYTGLTPSMTEAVEIVSGQRETLAVQFYFSEDWSAYKLRTAMFSSRTATRAQMIEEDGTAVIPSEVIRNGERYVKISAFGTLERADGEIERYNGRAITLRIDIGGEVEESGGCTDATAYEKLLVRVTALEERVDNLPAGGGGGEGSSVALDTTLTKPGYAADAKAVGDAITVQNDAIKKKLDAEKLPAAVETALEEAKESGEFDGPPGQPGEPGTTPHIGENGNWWIGTTDTGTKAQGEPGQPGEPGTTPHIGANGNWWIGTTDTGVEAQGEPGAPGDDYVLTDEDINEIASAAAEKINISGKADKASVPNSATVNADNELVMQHTDGDAVTELFKVALPAGGGGGEWELIQDVTLTEDVAVIRLENGTSYHDVTLVITPLKINNETGDGDTSAKLQPTINFDWTRVWMTNIPVNSSNVYVFTSLWVGGARITKMHGMSANNYFTTGPTYWMPDGNVLKHPDVGYVTLTMPTDWYLKSGCRVVLYGRK